MRETQLPNTPNSAFEKFLRDIEPSPTTKSGASSAHAALRDHLAASEVLEDRHVRTFLSGSYRRDTAIRPRVVNGKLERPDIDVIMVVEYTTEDDPGTVLGDLHAALTTGPGGYPNTRRQSRSVPVETAQAIMDSVPLIAPFGDGGSLFIPDKKLETWLETNPPAHTEWTTGINKRSGGRFKPLVKMMKWWRRENPTISKHPKGFVIECLVAEDLASQSNHYGEMFLSVLDGLLEKYEAFADLETVPFISDPAVPGNPILGGVSGSAFKGFINKAEGHVETVRKALAEEDGAVATRLWRAVFGPRFPEVTSTGQGARGGMIPVPPVQFPDRPVRPNRPGGFARGLVPR
jgi:hypothetical protein